MKKPTKATNPLESRASLTAFLRESAARYRASRRNALRYLDRGEHEIWHQASCVVFDAYEVKLLPEDRVIARVVSESEWYNPPANWSAEHPNESSQARRMFLDHLTDSWGHLVFDSVKGPSDESIQAGDVLNRVNMMLELARWIEGEKAAPDTKAIPKRAWRPTGRALEVWQALNNGKGPMKDTVLRLEIAKMFRVTLCKQQVHNRLNKLRANGWADHIEGEGYISKRPA